MTSHALGPQTESANEIGAAAIRERTKQFPLIPERCDAVVVSETNIVTQQSPHDHNESSKRRFKRS